jgi:hypothetical protein
VQDLDRQVLAALAKDVLLLLADHLAGAVVRIHHTVAELELDIRWKLGLEVIEVLFR